VSQHPELLIQRHGATAGGRLELRRQGCREEKKQNEKRGTDGEKSPTHRPRP
jgi:hypothetical protein